MNQLIEIPWDALEPDTLQRLVEEFVTRDGTDYGEQEVVLERKVSQVVNGIRHREYVIVFEPDSQATHILTRHQWREAQSSAQDGAE